MLRRVSSSSTLSTLPQIPRLPSMKAGSSISAVRQCGVVLERVCDSFEALITRDKAITCDTVSPSPSVTHATNDADNTESRDDDSECDEYASTSYPPSLGNCDGCEPNFFGTRRTGCGARQQTLTEVCALLRAFPPWASMSMTFHSRIIILYKPRIFINTRPANK